jgi:hypothetical protein
MIARLSAAKTIFKISEPKEPGHIKTLLTTGISRWLSLNSFFMRSRKPVFILTCLFFASFGIIALLAFVSKHTYDKKNGFNRQLRTSTLTSRTQIAFPVPVSKIIGSQAGKLYFQGNSPYELYSTDLNGDSIMRIPLSIPSDRKLGSGFQMYLSGSQLYLSVRNKPGIIVYNLDSGNANSHELNQYFSKDAFVAKDEFILRTINRGTNDPVFIRIDLKNRQSRVEDHFSEKNGKGNFPTDGILYYDSSTHRACYTYFYQNGFICMDTNLNLLLKARTVDTVTKRQIEVVHVGSSYTMKQPPPLVNYVGSVSAGKLYLQSMLKADNELPLNFAENTVIDAYSLINGNYIASFYIPPYKGKKPYNFNIIGKKLYAIYGKAVVVYDLPSI